MKYIASLSQARVGIPSGNLIPEIFPCEEPVSAPVRSQNPQP